MRRSVLLLLLSVQIAFAGGPLNIAGVTGFQPGLAGTPITWANGQITYYTDQGSLSSLLSGSDADQLVADALSRWTAVSTAALTATHGGSLNEDVNGTNVWSYNGSLTVPADLQPNSGKPLAIVYDVDGRVFDVLMGVGAGAPEMCSSNSVYGVTDAFSADAHITHALVVINGNCVKTPSQLALIRYQLVRVFGQILGLDYSQLNDNIFTGSPSPTLDDYAGYPLMHPLGLLCTEWSCQSDADQPRMDDRAAISRLYPVTSANQSAFPGKQLFASNTARIHGSVLFGSVNGISGQGMQGVNVVARLVDPNTGRVSRRYGASSVSGFLFSGDAGNSIFGFTDALGRPLDSVGSTDPALEGLFDLAGLEIPAGYSQATYELSVEPVNQLFSGSTSVGPYKGGPVAISGTFTPIRLTIPQGGSVVQDIAMQGVPKDTQDQSEPASFNSPSALPPGGDWFGSLSGYGDRDYLTFIARADRSFTFDVTALEENKVPAATKAQPVLGLWGHGDAETSPRDREDFFNSAAIGKTRLQASITSAGEYKLGIMDARGDGRPDFLYEARLFYADDLAPSRASVKGGTTITLSGTGFSPSSQVQVGGTTVAANVIAGDRIVFSSPSLPDGTYSILVTDAADGASSQMDNVLRIGGADAHLVLLSGSNPQVPVGTQAPNPMRVQVVDSTTGEPVAGATVQFSVPATAGITGCAQQSCILYTDALGTANAYIQVKAEGASQITASLPGGNSVATTVNGIIALLDISLPKPTLYVSSTANTTFSVQAMVVANGAAVPNRTVNFLLNSGTATIAPISASTAGDGIATSAISINALSKDVNISACVGPNNTPCRTLLIHPVGSAASVVQKISGDQQMINVGQAFAPVTVRVVDPSANPVLGASVMFMVDVYRAPSNVIRTEYGDLVVTTRDDAVILSTSWTKTTSDASGLATCNLSVNESQPVKIVVRAVAGTSEAILSLQSVWSSTGSTTTTVTTNQVRQQSISDAVSTPTVVTNNRIVMLNLDDDQETAASEKIDLKVTDSEPEDSCQRLEDTCPKRRRVRVEKPSQIPRTAN